MCKYPGADIRCWPVIVFRDAFMFALPVLQVQICRYGFKNIFLISYMSIGILGIILNPDLYYFPIQKIQVSDVSTLSADWATNSQHDWLKQVQLQHKKKKKIYWVQNMQDCIMASASISLLAWKSWRCCLLLSSRIKIVLFEAEKIISVLRK